MQEDCWSAGEAAGMSMPYLYETIPLTYILIFYFVYILVTGSGFGQKFSFAIPGELQNTQSSYN